jgi:hypothetical protein
VRLAGVILVLIVFARGLIFLSDRFSPPASGPASASNPDANATPPARDNLSPEPSAPKLAISVENVEHIASLATWGQGALRAAYFAPDGSQFALLTNLDLMLYDAAINHCCAPSPSLALTSR